MAYDAEHWSDSELSRSRVFVRGSSPLDQDAADDSEAAVVMAVDSRRDSDFGCCYFTANEGGLFVMSDIRNGTMDSIAALKAQIQPTVIILPLQISEQMDACFQAEAPRDRASDEQEDGVQLPYALEYRPSTDFSEKSAKRRLLDLPQEVYVDDDMLISTGADEYSYDVSDELQTGPMMRHSKYLRTSAVLDFGNAISIGCAGAVLAHLARYRSTHELPGHEQNHAVWCISIVKMFGIDNFMFVNEDTQASLQILQTESSPNTHSQGPSKGASGEKEGLSIFGLFKKFLRTSQGKQRLRQLLSRPTLDPALINERLDSVSFFSRAENEECVKGISKDLGHIKNLRVVLRNLKKGITNASNTQNMASSVWSALRSAAYHALQIKDAFIGMSGVDRLKIGISVLETFHSEDLSNVGRRINAFVDFEKSEQMHRIVVATGVNEDLDKLRHAYDGMEHMLDRVTREIASTVPYPGLGVIFFPQIGFLICLPREIDTGQLLLAGEADAHGRWDPVFTSTEQHYFKNASMRDLDSSWGDVYASICDAEIEIVHELTIAVLQQESLLSRVSDVCGDLDCLIALARGARSYGFNKPQIVAENIIDIKGGRHPLQEHCVPSFIPNDTFLVGGYDPDISTTLCSSYESGSPDETLSRKVKNDRPNGPSMIMVTGPNFSGKSVYLKSVASIVYLAHVGSYVPADRATIGLTDAILTRVTARDTVSRMQSTFVVDMQQTALALNLATHRSLILLDEIGKGTETSDGIGIASSVYQYLLSPDRRGPKVVAATHLHELFETDHLTNHQNLALRFMDVKVEADADERHESVTYLYSLHPGRSNASHGTQCAARNGIDSGIIARARALGDLDVKGEDLVAACATISSLEEQELHAAEELARDFLAQGLGA